MDWGAEFLLEYSLITDGFLFSFQILKKKQAMGMANLASQEQYLD